MASEKRLIDANALMDVIRQHEYRLATKQGSIDYGMFTLGIQQAVDEQPTVDAVPVVRCSECKYHEDTSVTGYKHCYLIDKTVYYNYYCSYGIRKDGDRNG